MNQIQKAIIISILILTSLITGYLVSRGGKPYNVPLFGLHKIVTVAAVVFLILYLKRMTQEVENAPVIASTAAVISLASLILLVATGGMMSVMESLPASVKTGHRILPYLALISSGLTTAFNLSG